MAAAGAGHIGEEGQGRVVSPGPQVLTCDCLRHKASGSWGHWRPLSTPLGQCSIEVASEPGGLVLAPPPPPLLLLDML